MIDRLPIRIPKTVRLVVRAAAIGWLAVFVALVVVALTAPAAVADNCSVFTDCFGQSEAASEAALGLTALAALSLIIDFIGGAGPAFGGLGRSGGWDRALGLMRLSMDPDGAIGPDGRGAGFGGMFGRLLRTLPAGGPWAGLSTSGQWWTDLFNGPNTTADVTSAVNHFFGTDVFDGERWSSFLGDLGEGSLEISTLNPMSPTHWHLAATDPGELLSRYGSFGLGLWDFGSGLAVTAYDASSLTPSSPGFFVELHRYSETGEHRGLTMMSAFAEVGSGLSSLNPSSPTFGEELAEVITTGSIADHEGLQTAGQLVVGMLDWETFQSDPSRWFGRMSGEAVLEVTTGGAASGAGLSDNLARAVNQATDAIEPGVPRGAGSMTDEAVDAAGAPAGDVELLDPSLGSAVVEPDLTDNLARSSAGDPVDLASGSVFIPITDVSLPGVLPLVLRRTHLSSYRWGGLFGPSWASTLDERIEVGAERAVYAGETGERVEFVVPKPGARTNANRGRRLRLTRHETDEAWTVDEPTTGITRIFSTVGLAAGSGGTVAARLTTISDRSGNRIDIERDGHGLPTAVVHSGGYRIEIDVAAATDTGAERIRALRLVTERGETPIRRFGYDDAGNLAVVVDPPEDEADGRAEGTADSTPRPEDAMRYFYDADRRVVRWQDRNGTEYAYRYDEQGRCVQGVGTDGILTSTMAYEPGRTTVTNSLGEVQTYEFNDRGQTIRHTDAAGRVTESAWDALDRPLWRRDAMGRTSTYRYSDYGGGDGGDLVAVEGPGGRRFELSYAEPGLVSMMVAPDGGRWLSDYDGNGNVVRSVDPSGAATEFGYGPTGAVAWVRDPTGRTTSYATDGAGLVRSITSPTGAVTRIGRDEFGRTASIVDPVGGETRAEYTVRGWLRRLQEPDGGVELWSHDGEGNTTAHTDALGRVTGYEHTPFDQVAAVVRADGSRTELTYDTEGRVIGAVDPMDRPWSYELDRSGWVTAETDVNGRTVRYRRDDLGRVTERTNAGGQVTRYTYDDAGNLSAKDVDGVPTSYGYDGSGRLLRSRSAEVDHRVERDAMGRVVAESWNNLTVRFRYDEAGRRVGQQSASGVGTEWRYDDDGELVELSTAGRSIGFSRDDAGREIGRRLGDSAILEQAWTAGRRLAGQRVRRVDGAAVQERAYVYNPIGELTGVDDAVRGRHRYELDEIGRITARTVDRAGAVTREAYRYDPAGTISATAGLEAPDFDGSGPNQTSATTGRAGIGGAPQDTRDVVGTMIRRAGRDDYGHDRDGRVVFRRRKRLSQPAAVWHFEWDGEDRLTTVVTPDGVTWRYLYDGLDRRVAKQQLGPDGTIATQTWFVWDGYQIIEQLTLDANGQATDASIWNWNPSTGHGLSQLDLSARTTPTGPQEWYDQRFYSIITDLIGTPTELINDTGTLTWAPTQTTWGTHTNTPDSPTQPTCPWRSPGQYHDPETNLHYNVHRYYNPTTATYLTPDPLGLTANTNPHTAVPNPTTWTDPLGLTPYNSDPNGGVDDAAGGVADRSTRSLLRDARLPGGSHSDGNMRFLAPTDLRVGNGLPRSGQGYVDRFGNVWQRGPAHGRAFADGHAFEWDVQLSEAGRRAWGDVAHEGVGGQLYVNVTPDGSLSH